MAVKRILVIAIVMLIPALARADSYVSVNLLPEPFAVGVGGETAGATFILDTTTNTISDVTLTATGQWQGVSSGTGSWGGGKNLVLENAAGDSLYMDYSFHNFQVTPVLTSAPGIYATDLWIICPQCTFVQTIDGGPGVAIVTSLGDGDHDGDDPVSTPESSSLVSLLAGLLGLTTLAALSKKSTETSTTLA